MKQSTASIETSRVVPASIETSRTVTARIQQKSTYKKVVLDESKRSIAYSIKEMKNLERDSSRFEDQNKNLEVKANT